MNPCGCRSAGSCSCCSEQRQRRIPVSPKQKESSLTDCDPSRCSCSGASCSCPLKRASPAAEQRKEAYSGKIDSAPATSNCCSSKGPSTSAAPSIELLLQAVDMSTAFVPPPCGCGDNCRCARCLSKSGKALASHTDGAQYGAASHRASSTITASSASPKTPPAAVARQPVNASAASAPGCDDCAACDLALERPSGIGAVDSWMEKQRQSSPRSSASSVHHQSRTRSPSMESIASTSRRSSHAEASLSEQRASVSVTASVPTLHGGLLTSEPGSKASSTDEEVRAELVLVHPKCAACLEVVRNKGIGVLSSVSPSSSSPSK